MLTGATAMLDCAKHCRAPSLKNQHPRYWRLAGPFLQHNHRREVLRDSETTLYCGRHVISTRTGISFLTGTAKSDGGSILKSDSVAGMVPEIRIWFPCVASWNGTCLYWAVWPANWISRSAWIVADPDSGFGQSGAHADHGKLRAAGDLQHVKIAVAVARIKGFHRYRDQEIALSRVANALASRGMADALGLMQRVRHMVGERGLFQDPLAYPLRRKRGSRETRRRLSSHSCSS